ncbi:hypothetical protein REPUB_Repub04eG0250100 [Reevesia pubescens]
MLCFMCVWMLKLEPWLLCFVGFVGLVAAFLQLYLAFLLLGRSFWWFNYCVGLDSSLVMESLRNVHKLLPFVPQALQTFFGYEPYPGFHAIVQAKIEAEINEWQEKKQKLIS